MYNVRNVSILDGLLFWQYDLSYVGKSGWIIGADSKV
jgi:hypothetical protein